MSESDEDALPQAPVSVSHITAPKADAADERTSLPAHNGTAALRAPETEAPPFAWNAKRTKAVELLAQDVLSDEKIAREIGVGRRTLAEWKTRPQFRVELDRLRAELLDEARAFGIASQRARLEQQQGRWERMQEVIRQRASSEPPRVGGVGGEMVWNPATQTMDFVEYPKGKMPAIPGWDTGLLVHDVKTNKDSAYDVYEVDSGLLGEIRALEAQVAKELGQSAEPKGPTSAKAKLSASTGGAEDEGRLVEFVFELDIGEAGGDDE